MGPLGQLFPEASSLVAMAPLLRGLGLMGSCAWCPWRRGCSGPSPKAAVNRVSSFRRKMLLSGAEGALKRTRQMAEGTRCEQEQKERQGETRVNGGSGNLAPLPSDQKTVGT